MEVVNRLALVAFQKRHGTIRVAIDRWVRLVEAAEWRNFNDLRATLPHADQVRSGEVVFTIFNVGGNKCRIIATVNYETQIVVVVAVLTHAEYDRMDI